MTVALLTGIAIGFIVISPDPRSNEAIAQVLGLIAILIIVVFLTPTSRE
ncbi:hypothetical protein [Streptomyces microflavus]